jgi:hypothetical protein
VDRRRQPQRRHVTPTCPLRRTARGLGQISADRAPRGTISRAVPIDQSAGRSGDIPPRWRSRGSRRTACRRPPPTTPATTPRATLRPTRGRNHRTGRSKGCLFCHLIRSCLPRKRRSMLSCASCGRSRSASRIASCRSTSHRSRRRKASATRSRADATASRTKCATTIVLCESAKRSTSTASSGSSPRPKTLRAD